MIILIAAIQLSSIRPFPFQTYFPQSDVFFFFYQKSSDVIF